MKKIAVVVVLVFVLLGAAYCGAGWWLGAQAQKQYEIAVDQKIPLYLRLPKENPYIQLSIRSYERGIFHSTAVTSVVLNIPDGQPLRFLVINSIQHGPIAFSQAHDTGRSIQPAMAVISTTWAGEGEAGDAIKGLLEKIPELKSSEIQTILKFDGSGESYANIPAFKKTSPNNKGQDLTVDWGGLKGQWRFDILSNKASGFFSIPTFAVSDPDQQLVLKSLTGDFDMQQGEKSFATGEVKIACENMEFRGGNGAAPFNMKSAMLRESSWFSGDAVNVSITTGFEKLTAEQMNFGPFAFELELRKLDSGTLARFQQKMQGLQAQLFGKPGEETVEQLSILYKQFLTELLAKSPEMEIKQFKATTPWGDFDARFFVSVSEAGGLIVENPLAALTSVSASLNASVSERLLNIIMQSGIKSDLQKEGINDPAMVEGIAAERTKSLLQDLLANNLIVRENQNIKASAAYQPGQLIVNGKPLSLQDFLR